MFRALAKLARPLGLRYMQPYRFFSQETSFKSPLEKHTFKAETQKLLEIVAKSLYMDKEVFVRELVSNASDALEKQRFREISGEGFSTEELKIKITTDPVNGIFKIFDSGIGMNGEELVKNLGTIAYSGSRNFIESLADRSKAESIIGQFGVGFYSSFIVAKEVRVISKKDETAYIWTSEGQGDYQIAEIDGASLPRGTEITVHLKDDSRLFANDTEISRILKKYSNFVSYPIELNGTAINVQQAIWSKNKNSVTEDEYRDFFEYVAGQKVPYKYKLHFSLDVPVSIKALLYIPASHKEKFGLSHEDFELSLYSRKVLISAKCTHLLPNWLRFVKGVVDCEDIPLNISRESFQDSALMNKIKEILTNKIVKFLTDESTRNEDSYSFWYQEFGNFLLEGVASQSHSKEILPLLRYSWNLNENAVSLKTYVQNMKPGQNRIYYLYAPNRQNAIDSPYLESFKPKGIPVIFSHVPIDEMIFRTNGDFQGHKFINIESSSENIEKDQIEGTEYNSSIGISEPDLVPFTDWVLNELQPRVSKVIISSRLRESPAVVVGDLPSAIRQAYKIMDREKLNEEMVRNQNLEVNPNHELIVSLNQARKKDPELASQILLQIFENALITADILENLNPTIKRINEIMLKLLKAQQNK